MKTMRMAAGALLLAAFLFGEVEAAEPGRIPAAQKWRYSFTDDLEQRLPAFDDSAWRETELPATLDGKASGGSTYLWLRASLTLPQGDGGRRLFLLAGKIWGAVEIYLNGVIIGFQGRFPPDYQYNGGLLKQAMIPADLLRADGNNVVAMRVFNESSTFRVSAPAVGGLGEYTRDESLLNFLNVRVYLIFSMLSFFIFLYFILQYALRTKERPKLLFALSNLGIAIYFLNMGLNDQFLPFIPFSAVSKSMLCPSIAVLAVFFVEFFRIHDRLWVKLLILLPAVGLALPFYFFPKSSEDVYTLFNLSLFCVEADILFMTYVAVRALVKRNRDAVPIIFGTVLGILLGSYDVIRQFSGSEPPFWLQGIGIFCFDLSMFAALSLQTIRMHRDLETYSIEVRHRTEELERYIRSAGEVSASVSGIARDLEAGIGSASESVEMLSRRSGEITTAIGSQFAVVKETQSTVMGLLGSLDGVYAALESQAREVEETSATIERMLSSLQGITEKLKMAADFTGELGGKTQAGGDAVLSSTEAIGKVRDASASIHKIVDTVNELAEQTNLLAMNAAIQAVHAGSYGRGFAVVASEIKSLAQASSLRSQEIMEHVDSIGGRIEDGVRVNAQVKEILMDIAKNTGSAIAQVQAVYESVAAQREASVKIKSSLSSLLAATGKIREQADAQKAGSGMIRSRLDQLVNSSEEVLSSVKAISEENGRIVDLISKIRATSVESRKITAQMDSMLKRDAAREAGK